MFSIHLEYPEFLLLTIPLFWLYWHKMRMRGALGALRVALLLLVVFTLARPAWEMEGKGRTLILMIDRSSSLPASAHRQIQEQIKLIRKEMGPGDKIGVVTFGQGTNLEAFPTAHPSTSEFFMKESQPASDLAEGLEMAQKLLGRKKGKILLISDGKYTGLSPQNQALNLFSKGIVVDYIYLSEPLNDEIALSEVSFPDQVEIGKPFQYALWMDASRDTEVTILVHREGQLIAKIKKSVIEGKNRFYFRDLLTKGGSYIYKISLLSPSDQTPENNLGLGVVQARAGPTILVITPKGRRDNFTRALGQSKIPLEVISASQAPTRLSSYDRYRAVIIENVPVKHLQDSLLPLRQFVENLGGGLLLTGGKQSFGSGGYYKSTLDPILPVSMELRKEHHKLKVSMVITMDRSGSMGMSAGLGRTKMDLANEGACAVINLLSPMDEIAVVAVDSSPHLIVPLQPVANPGAMTSKVRRIESRGGGIYTYTALKHAAGIIRKSSLSTRHIILFADAGDAEEPGAYKKLLADLRSEGITVSVIALGRTTDSDAAFLRDVARRGGGRIFFSMKPAELPRLFAQETITIAKSSFVDEATPAKMTPGYFLLGSPLASAFPTPGGFNLTYLRPRASLGTQTIDEEYNAPILAFWYRGLGRVATFTAEVDGKYTGELAGWNRYGDYFVTLARWLVGSEPPHGYYVESRRKGSMGEVYLEVEDDKAPPPSLTVLTPSGKKMDLEFSLAEGGYKCTFSLREFGLYFPVLRLKNPKKNQASILRCPPLTLAYPAEFLPEVNRRDGKEVLAKIARVTRGKEVVHLGGIYEDIPFFSAYQDLTRYLALAILLLLFLEISARRLGFLATLQVFFVRIYQSLPSWPRRKKKAKSAPVSSVAEDDDPPKQKAPPPPEKRDAPPAKSLLSRAKKKAKDRIRE